MKAAAAVRVFRDADAAAQAAAAEWNAALADGTADRPRRVLLSGGSTPQTLYRALADARTVPRERWESIECFFGDERCVPPDHPDSNFGMVYKSLLEPLSDSAPRTHRMRAEDPDADGAARDYENLMRRQFAVPVPDVPRFDLALLGIGVDGHTASLFPGGAELDDPSRLVAAIRRPSDGSSRLTVTYALLNAARRVLFLVCGAEKAEVVSQLLCHPLPGASGAKNVRPLPPAARVRPESGEIVWILDSAAARLLE